MADYIAAIDQGTTSSRCIVFNRKGEICSVAQKEHKQHFPKPGWVEHDASEIWKNVETVVKQALRSLKIKPADLAAVGVTNQRETTLLWDKATGAPIHRAIVWQDTRTDRLCRKLGGKHGQDRFKKLCGLPLATYFSGPKIRWLLDEIDGARARAEAGEVLFGTMETWLIWKLTGRHVTDVTNASRTMLMNLKTLDWDEALLDGIGVPRAMLPEICSSSEVYGAATGVLKGVKVAGALGDQQAALFGQTCFEVGDGKCTYGTGGFMLLNTGEKPVKSKNGLLTTVGYKIGGEKPVYALEGSIAVAGSLVQWFRDNIGLVKTAPDIETLAKTVKDNGGCYFVPAFSGLFAPYWRSDARGVIAGLTAYVTKAHLARAVLEATCWQVREVVEAMNADSRRRSDLPEGRRRHGGQQPPDADAGRHPRRAGSPAEGDRDLLPRRGLCGGAGGGLLAEPEGAQGQLEEIRRVEAEARREDPRQAISQMEEGRARQHGLGG